MTTTEPSSGPDQRALLLDSLDYYRALIAEKLRGLDEDELRTSRLPSGWTPLGLLFHLTHMERRWLQWGFMGEQVDEPWGDRDGSGWHTPTATLPDLVDTFHRTGARTRAIVQAHPLTAVSSRAGRFRDTEPPTLGWIMLHVLQEYARHAGHLDIVRELADGSIGQTA